MEVKAILLVRDDTTTSFMQAADMFERWKFKGSVQTITFTIDDPEKFERKRVETMKCLRDGCKASKQTAMAGWFTDSPEAAFRRGDAIVMSDGKQWGLVDDYLKRLGFPGESVVHMAVFAPDMTNWERNPAAHFRTVSGRVTARMPDGVSVAWDPVELPEGFAPLPDVVKDDRLRSDWLGALRACNLGFSTTSDPQVIALCNHILADHADKVSPRESDDTAQEISE